MGKKTRVEALSKKWLSEPEAIVYLGKSAGFFANLRDTAQLPYYKVGKSIFYAVRDIDLLIEANRVI